MNWIKEFWNKIFQIKFSAGDVADVILLNTGKNVSHLTQVLKTMTGLSVSEIIFYTERTPIIIFKQIPRQSAIEVIQALEITGATVELRTYKPSVK